MAFTDRAGGVSPAPYDSFNLGRQGHDSAANIAANHARLAAATGCERLAIAAQVHSATVAEVGPDWPVLVAPAWAEPVEDLPAADGLVTRWPGTALVIRVADCVPVLLADAAARVVGAAHAGREGLLAGVLPATVAAMRGLGARRITAWIGPHICAACYEVPEAMAERAWGIVPASRAVSARGTPAIDLGAGAAAQLGQCGVEATRLDPCTACDPRFFSHRRDGGATGRQAGVIWLADQ